MEKCNRRPTSRHQQGAFAVLFAIVLAAFALMLVLVLDSGRLYMEKRSLQKVADMAALEAVSRKGSCLVEDDADNYAATLVQQAATRNHLFSNGGDIIDVACVDLTTNADGVREVTALNDASPIIQVITGKTVPASLVIRAGCLFDLCASDTVNLQASAIAGQDEPIAAFSVGSRLLRFDGASTLGGLLSVVGINLDNTAVASYNGLANVDITPDGLLKELGLDITADMTVGDLNTLLAAETVNVLDLLDVVANLAGQQELLAANLVLLQQLAVAAGVPSLNVAIPLLTQADGTPGLFAEIVAPLAQRANTALGVQLNALSVLETAIGIATHEHALEVKGLDLNLLELVKVSAKVGVVEPPSIVIGGVGATAYTAQVRTFIHLQTGELAGAINNLVSLLGINLIDIDLPIALDLVSGKGVLEENTCTAAADIHNTGRDHAEISVTGDVAKLCIGKPRDESKLFSKYESCDAYMDGMKYLDVLGLVTLNRTNDSPLALGLLSIPEDPEGYVYLSEDSTPLPAAWADMEGRMDFATVGSNPLAVGDLVEDLLELLLDASTIKYDNSENQRIAEEIWVNAEPEGSCLSGMSGIPCRKAKLETIEDLSSADTFSGGLLGNLLKGLVSIVGDLLGTVGEILVGNGCTTPGLLGALLNPPSDANCISKIVDSLPNNSTPANNLGLGILTDLLNALGSNILSPLLTDLLGLRVSEVDVHLQDLNCGHAKLLR
ncbi:MAG: pilus assembly protein TadG-related protein [Porticoccaceae bacterium]|nr:pilus assembly protein TadG-related protein [Porticoccaceae bacterium]